MKPEGISTNLFRTKLATEVKKLGGPAAAARLWGVFPQNVSNAMSGDRLPVKGILAGMGYEPVKEIRYRYKRIEQ